MQTVPELIKACNWGGTSFLAFSSNVFDPFIYYSHLVPLLLSLLIGFFVFIKNPKLLTAKILLGISVLFSLWVFFDLILWATDKPSQTIFFWSLLVLIGPLIYAGSLYFIQTFITNNDISLKNKILLTLPLLLTIVLAFTKYSVSGFDLTNCDREAIEGPLARYGYGVEIFYTLCVAVFAMERFRKIKDSIERKKIVLVTVGILLFLLTFSWGNIVGTFSDDWRLPQWGLFGMPIFIAFLSYLIVKYHEFNIKLIATQALVTTLSILIGSQFFFIKVPGNKILNAITFVISFVAGVFLIRSVKKEVELRESLQIANEGQTNLIHILNHQIKGYLSKSRNIFAELLTGTDYGPINGEVRPMLQTGFDSLTEGVGFVEQVLNSSSAESGTLVYNMQPMDFKTLILETGEKQREQAEKKELSFEIKTEEGKYSMTGDAMQLKEAMRDLIENSINYTPAGSIKINLSNKNGKILFSITDTGVGISEEDKPKLFTKGGRGKDSLKFNVNSTGYGLSFVKAVIEAHKGRVWAESQGVGKGSTFFVELPIS